MSLPIKTILKDVAQLRGYDAAGVEVYSATLERSDYWDGEHLWDCYAKIRAIGMVKLVGKLFDENGQLYEEFENAYSPETGQLVGSKIIRADGTKNAFGTLA